jgi:hypothetical protein
VQTPRRCGQASSAGTLLFWTLRFLGLRTSWLIVAIYSVSKDVMFVLCIKKTGEADPFLQQMKGQKVKAISLVRISLLNNALG